MSVDSLRAFANNGFRAGEWKFGLHIHRLLPSARINPITHLRDDYADNYYQQSDRSHRR